MTTKAAKVAHVLRSKQTRDHHCHWPGCTEQVPPAKWGCRRHWFMLPKSIRDEIWNAYQPNQESTMTPSQRYLAAAMRARRWIRDHDGSDLV